MKLVSLTIFQIITDWTYHHISSQKYLIPRPRLWWQGIMEIVKIHWCLITYFNYSFNRNALSIIHLSKFLTKNISCWPDLKLFDWMECVGGHWIIAGQCETHYCDTTITSDNIEKLSRKQLAQPQIIELQSQSQKIKNLCHTNERWWNVNMMQS